MPGWTCVEFCCGAAWKPLDIPKPSLKVSEPTPIGSGSARHPGFGLGRGEGRTSLIFVQILSISRWQHQSFKPSLVLKVRPALGGGSQSDEAWWRRDGRGSERVQRSVFLKHEPPSDI